MNNLQIAGGWPVAEMKGINQKRKNICLILFYRRSFRSCCDGPDISRLRPGCGCNLAGCILRFAIQVTCWFTCLHWAPGRSTIQNAKENQGQNTSSSLSIHNVAKENPRPNTCTQRSLRGSMGTLLPAWPLWKIRDVIGSWWIGIWYPKCT